MVLSATANAQLRSAYWPMGYASSGYPESFLQFQQSGPTVNFINRPINMFATCASICDTIGNLLFYTNGADLVNNDNRIMLNGSMLSPGGLSNIYRGSGFPFFQATITVPKPGNSHTYYLFHETMSVDTTYYYAPKELFYSEIDMVGDSGHGEVIQKNLIALQKPINVGISACKHANGRDWWVLVQGCLSNNFYRILLTPGGIASVDSQSIGGSISQYGGSVAFSPDGRHYASFDNLSQLRIYDFDRCTGLLSNFQYYPFNDGNLASGLEFSANSQVLYFSSNENLYQLDISTPGNNYQLIDSNDGYISAGTRTTFCLMRRALDGRIYITSCGSVIDLGVINMPDSLGTACNFQQHSLPLNSINDWTMPNFPNYELGPDVGTICDSLTGIQNINQSSGSAIKIFPNPCSNKEVTISYDPVPYNRNLELFNSIGECVYSRQLQSSTVSEFFSVEKFCSGIYLIKITGNITLFSKLMINH